MKNLNAKDLTNLPAAALYTGEPCDKSTLIRDLPYSEGQLHIHEKSGTGHLISYDRKVKMPLT